MNFERILTELRFEKFEWFGPSPIEPFNPGRDGADPAGPSGLNDAAFDEAAAVSDRAAAKVCGIAT